ncbi:helix-turn-helix transcriptional regulator [Algiphilus sp. W345]|uniref:Helix-turn-helix transcriptional regulator n=1 Tax=Banduia mediterranea TaxID=3075609 RepID=A0ABU2WER4_9GAMM|nr:helix-turn-helix transcriptional regulator [Algiphilus sp. W345]MDT0496350.1 helix-turn-helix transcriptional regulator [Algiphilus sp. W345]
MTADLTNMSVWHHLYSPEEAALMESRAELMAVLQKRVKGWRVTQIEAAARLGVTQPRLSDLVNGRLSKFSLDALHKMASRSGLAPVIVTKPARRARSAPSAAAV